MNNIVIGFIVLLAGAGLFYMNSSSQDVSTTSSDAAMVKDEQKMEKDGDAMMKKEEGEVMEKDGDSMEKMEKSEEEVMMKKEDGDSMEKMEKDGDAMMKKEEEDVMKKEDETVSATFNSPGSYSDYSESKVAQASGDTLLFFHAAWCPSCRTLESDIQANTSNIPGGLQILKVDYDSASALKAKYGVRSQHTIVQVDSEGNMVQSWAGGSTLASLVARI